MFNPTIKGGENKELNGLTEMKLIIEILMKQKICMKLGYENRNIRH